MRAGQGFTDPLSTVIDIDKALAKSQTAYFSENSASFSLDEEDVSLHEACLDLQNEIMLLSECTASVSLVAEDVVSPDGCLDLQNEMFSDLELTDYTFFFGTS